MREIYTKWGGIGYIHASKGTYWFCYALRAWNRILFYSHMRSRSNTTVERGHASTSIVFAPIEAMLGIWNAYLATSDQSNNRFLEHNTCRWWVSHMVSLSEGQNVCTRDVAASSNTTKRIRFSWTTLPLSTTYKMVHANILFYFSYFESIIHFYWMLQRVMRDLVKSSRPL